MKLTIPAPNEKQKLFFLSKTKYTAYGGARGGGKSWAVRQKAKLMALKFDGIQILILRRTYKELESNHIRPLAADLKGIAKYNDSKKIITFPNGSLIIFGYMMSASDELQYQGQEYDIIFIDEATQFDESTFTTLKACLRGVNNFPKRMYLTCNPGGIGHAWVKRLFIDRDFILDGEYAENPDEYTFIQAKVQDNTALMKTDPGYIEMLKAQPPDIREAWLNGSWDCYEGQYFTDFNRELHVVEPFTVPAYWRIYRVFDYGLDMLACYWIAVDEIGSAWVVKELYQSDMIISDAAAKIIEYSMMPDGKTPMTIYETLAPPDLWSRSKDSGITTADTFRDNGLPLHQCDNARVFGWLNVKEYLKPVIGVDGETTARLKIFSTCRNLIRCLPLLQHDEKNPDDCATEPHEITHAPDSLRYYCQHRPVSAKLPDMRKPEQVMLANAKKAALGGNRKRAKW